GAASPTHGRSDRASLDRADRSRPSGTPGPNRCRGHKSSSAPLPTAARSRTSPPCQNRSVLRLERAHLLLRYAEDHHAVAGRESSAILGHDGVFVLARFELDLRNVMAGGEGFDRGDVAIMNGAQQCGRGNWIAEMIVHEIAEAA